MANYVVFGTVMMMFFAGQWQEEKQALLTKNASSVANFTSAFTELSEITGKHVLDVNSLAVFLTTLARNMDADIYVTDLEGNRLIGVYPNSQMKAEDLSAVSAEQVEQAVSGFYEERGTCGGVYPTDYYNIGVPFTVTNSTGVETVAGAVFASTNVSGINTYMLAIFQIFILAMIVTLAITFLIVWAFTYRMIKPLRQMSKAAKSFGSGDFSSRVAIQSSDEIGELSLAFNNMANSLSNSEGMRRSFIANVSHELKTPMTTIGGFIDGILDGTIPPDKQKTYLKIVSDEIKRLSRLVKSMLDLSRIDSGDMNLNPVKFNLTDKVFSTLLSFENSIENKKIEILGLEDAPPLSVMGDQDLLHQVVYNLIENAVKFTNEGGFIKFYLTDTFDRVCVTIENSGRGIDGDELPMIFDRFYKTDRSRSEDKNGMGLGLYLVKTIINLHGGDVNAGSTPNLSTKFGFFIPKEEQKKKLTNNSVINLNSSVDIDIQEVE